jgi:hypothetical protein
MKSRYPGKQPRKDAAAPEERQQRPTKNLSSEIVPNTAPTVNGELLKDRNNPWLFEVSEGLVTLCA